MNDKKINGYFDKNKAQFYAKMHEEEKKKHKEEKKMDNKNHITITMTLEEWEEIHSEAWSHLCYWGADSKTVDKLRKIIEDHENEIL